MIEKLKLTQRDGNADSNLSYEVADMAQSFVVDVAKKVVDHILVENRIDFDTVRERVFQAVLNYELQRRNLNTDFFYQPTLIDILTSEIRRLQREYSKNKSSLTPETFFSTTSLEDPIRSEIEFIIQEMETFHPEISQKEQSTWFDRVGLTAVEFWNKLRRTFKRRTDQ